MCAMRVNVLIPPRNHGRTQTANEAAREHTPEGEKKNSVQMDGQNWETFGCKTFNFTVFKDFLAVVVLLGRQVSSKSSIKCKIPQNFNVKSNQLN